MPDQRIPSRSVLVFATVLLLSIAVTAGADTITSTAEGGLWFAGTTWQGGVVPGAADVVVVAGPVTIAGEAECASLEITVAGSLAAAVVAPPRVLRVGGPLTNGGVIAGGSPYSLDLAVAGDIHHAGLWTSGRLSVTGAGVRELSLAPGTKLTTVLEAEPGAGDLVATTPLVIEGDLDMSEGRLVLQSGASLTLEAGVLRGQVMANGNELRLQGWSYMTFCTIDDVVLVGEALASRAVTVTTRLVVMDSLRNSTAFGGGAVIVEGDLVNHGLITNNQYSFPLQVHGDLETYGEISCPQLQFMGVGVEHRLVMGPHAVIESATFLPEFQAATLIAETPVHFANDLGLGVGTLVLQPGASLHFSGFGGLDSGTVIAGGNTISVSENAAVSGVSIHRGVVGDRLVLHGEISFSGGLVVAGELTGWLYAAADLLIEGTLQVDGMVTNGAHPVRIRALGDVVNHGIMTNALVAMAGTVDQTVATGPDGIAVPEFVLESGLAGPGHQWYRNGQALPGETSPELVLVTVSEADHGVYHCEASGQVSRSVTIVEAFGTSVTPSAAWLALDQNHPNPFNPSTRIAFHLDHAGPVLLTVHDLAGREVDRLVSGSLAAGRHVVEWAPRRLASGTYLYRLVTGQKVLTRSCTLLK